MTARGGRARAGSLLAALGIGLLAGCNQVLGLEPGKLQSVSISNGVNGDAGAATSPPCVGMACDSTCVGDACENAPMTKGDGAAGSHPQSSAGQGGTSSGGANGGAANTSGTTGGDTRDGGRDDAGHDAGSGDAAPNETSSNAAAMDDAGPSELPPRDTGPTDAGLAAGDAGNYATDAGHQGICNPGPCQACVSGDGMCPAGCDGASDSDCKHALGGDCRLDSDCTLGHCAGGLCCDRACNGACEACDLAGQPGTCGTRDFSASDDALHCGGCNLPCSSQNIASACQAGACVGSCAPHYDDCNHDKRSDGCESNLETDPLHCGDCNTVCRYGACRAGTCAQAVYGFPVAGTSRVNLGPNLQLCLGIHISAAGTLVALGAQTKDAGKGLRIGLFTSDLSAPQDLVAQTGPLSSIAGDATEGLVTTPAQVAAGDYFMCVVMHDTLAFAAEPGTTTWWYRDQMYGDFPTNVGALSTKDMPRGDFYAVVIPPA